MCVVIHACAGDVCTLQVVRGLAFSHYKRKRCTMLLLLRFLAHATHVLSCACCALRVAHAARCMLRTGSLQIAQRMLDAVHAHAHVRVACGMLHVAHVAYAAYARHVACCALRMHTECTPRGARVARANRNLTSHVPCWLYVACESKHKSSKRKSLTAPVRPDMSPD